MSHDSVDDFHPCDKLTYGVCFALSLYLLLTTALYINFHLMTHLQQMTPGFSRIPLFCHSSLLDTLRLCNSLCVIFIAFSLQIENSRIAVHMLIDLQRWLLPSPIKDLLSLWNLGLQNGPWAVFFFIQPVPRPANGAFSLYSPFQCE